MNCFAFVRRRRTHVCVFVADQRNLRPVFGGRRRQHFGPNRYESRAGGAGARASLCCCSRRGQFPSSPLSWFQETIMRLTVHKRDHLWYRFRHGPEYARSMSETVLSRRLRSDIIAAETVIEHYSAGAA